MAKQFWQQTDSGIVLDKIRKTLTLPAFNRACGVARTSILCGDFESSDSLQASGSTTPRTYFNTITSPFNNTCEFWIKTQANGANTGEIIELWSSDTGITGFKVWCDRTAVNRLYVQFKNSNGTAYNIDIQFPFGIDEWGHLAFVYDKTNLSFKIYANGQLRSTTTIANYGIVSQSSSQIDCLHDRVSTFGSQGFKLAELRFWNVARTVDQIASDYTKLLGIGHSTLIQGFRFSSANQDVDGIYTRWAGTVLTTDYLVATTAELNYSISDDSPDLGLGASFIAKQFSVTLANKTSLLYPPTRPTDCNFALCVSWIDEDDSTITHRKMLWDSVDGTDIAPAVEMYRGEKLPLTFSLECWNTDGEATVDLDDDYILQTSQLVIPTTSIDSTATSAATPVGRTALAENFPLTPFPLTFLDTQTY